jgi:putative transposase
LRREASDVIERFFRRLKEECVWQHSFEDYREARRTIAQWIDWYNAERPHQALGYLSPVQFRAQQATLVA